MPYLYVHTLNGKMYYGAVIEQPREITLGNYKYHEISWEEFQLTVAGLTALYYEKFHEVPKQANKWDTDQDLKNKMLYRLILIAKQSHEEGERNNARSLYKKLSGREMPEC